MQCVRRATADSTGANLFLLWIVASCWDTRHTLWALSAKQSLLALHALCSDSMHVQFIVGIADVLWLLQCRTGRCLVRHYFIDISFVWNHKLSPQLPRSQAGKSVLLTLCHIYHICVYYFTYSMFNTWTTICILLHVTTLTQTVLKPKAGMLLRIASKLIWTSAANCLSQNMSVSPLEHTQGGHLMSGGLKLDVSPGQSGELLLCSMAISSWTCKRQAAAFLLHDAPTFQKCWAPALCWHLALCCTALHRAEVVWVSHDTLLARAATCHFSSLPLGCARSACVHSSLGH